MARPQFGLLECRSRPPHPANCVPPSGWRANADHRPWSDPQKKGRVPKNPAPKGALKRGADFITELERLVATYGPRPSCAPTTDPNSSQTPCATPLCRYSRDQSKDRCSGPLQLSAPNRGHEPPAPARPDERRVSMEIYVTARSGTGPTPFFLGAGGSITVSSTMVAKMSSL